MLATKMQSTLNAYLYPRGELESFSPKSSNDTESIFIAFGEHKEKAREKRRHNARDTCTLLGLVYRQFSQLHKQEKRNTKVKSLKLP